MAYTYQEARPLLTVENIILSYENREIRVLLIQRKEEPFKGEWALPGGPVRIDESLEEAAQRHLKNQSGIEEAYIEQFHTFGAVDRDPRGRSVSVTYYALINSSDLALTPGGDASSAAWFNIHDLPELAFDHAEILEFAYDRLKEKLKYESIGFNLLPHDFTLSDLQRLIETITGRTLDKRNFRKKILSLNILKESMVIKSKKNKPLATLYHFDWEEFEKMKSESNKLTLF